MSRLIAWLRPLGRHGELLVGPFGRMAPASLLLGTFVAVLGLLAAADDAVRRSQG